MNNSPNPKRPSCFEPLAAMLFLTLSGHLVLNPKRPSCFVKERKRKLRQPGFEPDHTSDRPTRRELPTPLGYRRNWLYRKMS